MFNQFRRIWADHGQNDKDFSGQEERLRKALEHLKSAAHDLSVASEHLLSVLSRGHEPERNGV
jgi:hypothetical protein